MWKISSICKVCKPWTMGLEIHSFQFSGFKSLVRQYRPQRSFLSTLLVNNEGSKDIAVDAQVKDKGSKACVTWTNGHSSNFHGQWLRLICHCDKCHDPVPNSFQYQPENFPLEIIIKEAFINGKNLIVTWENEDHTSVFPLEYLQEFDYTGDRCQLKRNSIRMKFYTDNKIPRMFWEEVKQSDEGLYRFLHNVNDRGICLLEKVPCEDKYILQVSNKIGPTYEAMYGQCFEVRFTESPINHAYTSSALAFHMDIPAFEAQPGLQLLHCLRFDSSIKGGETKFLDIYHVLEQYRKTNPEKFNILTQTPFTFTRVHYNRPNPLHAIFREPIILLNDNKEIISVRWHPISFGPILCEEDKMEDVVQAYLSFARAINQFPHQMAVRLQPGELVCFNNRRLAHGRNAFTVSAGGVRHLQGTYVLADDFSSKLNYLAHKLGKSEDISRIGNKNWT